MRQFYRMFILSGFTHLFYKYVLIMEKIKKKLDEIKHHERRLIELESSLKKLSMENNPTTSAQLYKLKIKLDKYKVKLKNLKENYSILKQIEEEVNIDMGVDSAFKVQYEMNNLLASYRFENEVNLLLNRWIGWLDFSKWNLFSNTRSVFRLSSLKDIYKKFEKEGLKEEQIIKGFEAVSKNIFKDNHFYFEENKSLLENLLVLNKRLEYISENIGEYKSEIHVTKQKLEKISNWFIQKKPNASSSLRCYKVPPMDKMIHFSDNLTSEVYRSFKESRSKYVFLKKNMENIKFQASIPEGLPLLPENFDNMDSL